VSLLTFDDDVQWLVKPAPISALQELPSDAFRSHGMTALLDAIGKGMHQIESEYGLLSKSVDKTFMRYAESKSNGSFGKQVFHFFEEDEE
jgi:hypothetical protein